MKRIGKGLLVVVLSWAIACAVFIARSQAVSNPSIESRTDDGADEIQSGVVAAVDGPIALTEGTTRITLEQPVAKNPQTLAARIAALNPGHHLYLILRDLRVKEQPGTLYRVYLDLPADAKPIRDDPHYVGLLNFFNAQVSGDIRPPDTGSSIFFSRDVTALVKNLQSRKLLCDETTITIISSGTPAADANAQIGRIEIVER